MAMIRAIFNADDFGRTSSINAAVIRAHREGILTSASLMVTGEAAAEAIPLARENPRLVVGLHLVCVDGRAALPAAQIPHLVGEDRRFPTNGLQVGLRYFFNPQAQEELGRELEAQFELFAQTRLSLSHVDGHCHLHIHPSIFPVVLRLAQKYGAQGIRIPRDDLWLSLSLDRSRLATKLAWYASHTRLAAKCHRLMAGSRLKTADRVYGLMQSGQMSEDYLLTVLRNSRARQAEFYFHPDLVAHPEDPYGPNPGDLATLLSPRLKQALQALGVKPATYADLGGPG